MNKFVCEKSKHDHENSPLSGITNEALIEIIYVLLSIISHQQSHMSLTNQSNISAVLGFEFSHLQSRTKTRIF